MYRISSLIIFVGLLFCSCEKSKSSNSSCDSFDHRDRTSYEPSNINAFVFNGLDTFYLYKDNQDVFYRDASNLITSSLTPEDLFETLTAPDDRFSAIYDDYEILENNFAGISVTDGIDFRLSYIDDTSDDLVAYVNYVANGSPADLAGIKRGDFFKEINGTQLNIDNYLNLINLDSYDLQLVEYNSSTEEFVNTEEINVVKEEFTENPIHINKIINYEGLNIGYLMYNSFIGGSENELNTVFGNFKAAGIDELILDLRYNGGGRVSTAVDLSGMITGQFDNQILISEQWNCEFQNAIKSSNPEFLNTRFRNTLTDSEIPLNSLNLTKVYVISSKRRTASASELVINGLNAYINVVHIGDSEGTVGKSQASITVYDSPNLTDKDNINSLHKYAIQPLIYKSANKNGFSVPNEGLTPDIKVTENVFNLGELGETSDLLLQTALDAIAGTNLAAKGLQKNPFGDTVGNSKETSPIYQRMYE